MQLKRYSAKVRKTRTGDDFVLRIDLGVADISIQKRFRLKDVEAPNVDGTNSAAEILRDQVHNDLVSSAHIIIEVLREHSSGVLLGKLFYLKGGADSKEYTNLNDELIAKGYKYR